MVDFPLADWSDVTERISRDDRELAEAQMALYAGKDGLERHGKDWRQTVPDLRTAVRAHNEGFRGGVR